MVNNQTMEAFGKHWSVLHRQSNKKTVPSQIPTVTEATTAVFSVCPVPPWLLELEWSHIYNRTRDMVGSRGRSSCHSPARDTKNSTTAEICQDMTTGAGHQCHQAAARLSAQRLGLLNGGRLMPGQAPSALHSVVAKETKVTVLLRSNWEALPKQCAEGGETTSGPPVAKTLSVLP